jgi:hypothetical protein
MTGEREKEGSGWSPRESCLSKTCREPFDYSTRTHLLCKMEKLAEKGFSHMLSFPNLKESYGWGNTHTHAWVYKCISPSRIFLSLDLCLALVSSRIQKVFSSLRIQSNLSL